MNDRLKSLRLKAGLTQYRAANLAGMTPQQWHDYESGRRQPVRYDVLDRIACALNCTIDEVLNATK